MESRSAEWKEDERGGFTHNPNPNWLHTHTHTQQSGMKTCCYIVCACFQNLQYVEVLLPVAGGGIV